MREGEGGCCCCLKKIWKLLVGLSQEDFGSGGDTGELCLTPAPHMSFTCSFKQYSSPDYVGGVRQWNGRPLHRPAYPLELQAPIKHPKGPHFSAPPFHSCFCYDLFFSPTTNQIFAPLLALERLRSLLDFSLDLLRSKQGFKVISSGDGKPEV